ncbi:MAG: preprotein translocase subunit SecG [Desulfosudis oleivorans]|nr:preprotein translocase subunit SecG [Desulfosudis oleivorans]
MLACLFLILIVLLQSGKGAEMRRRLRRIEPDHFFGSRGAATFLNKLTTVAAVVFMLTSLTLAMITSKGSSVIQQVPVEQAGPQKTPRVPLCPSRRAPPGCLSRRRSSRRANNPVAETGKSIRRAAGGIHRRPPPFSLSTVPYSVPPFPCFSSSCSLRLSGCVREPEVKHPDTITIGFLADAKRLLPLLASDSASGEIVSGQIFQALHEAGDGDIRITGELAESWDISPDGLSVTPSSPQGREKA